MTGKTHQAFGKRPSTWGGNLPSCLALAILFAAGSASAQVDVSDTGPGSDPTTYTTLKLAFDAINAGTHTGDITISITASTAETATAALNASGSGSASYSSVLIRPTTTATITGSITGAVIKLNGADNVTIDGRIGGTGSGRDLTVSNGSTSASTAAIWLSSAGTGLGATNNTIRNLEIACGALQTTGTNSTFGILMSGTTIGVSSNGEDNDNNSFIANRITRVRYGIVTRGATANLNISPIVTDNTIGPSSFGADEIGKAGIFLQADTGAIVSRNTVQYVGGAFANTSSGDDRIGIAIGVESWSNAPGTLTSNAYTVTNNVIHDIVEERTFSAVGILLGATNGTSPTNNLVANNFIYNVKANATNPDMTVGLGISGGHTDTVAHNSIYLAGDVDPSTSATASTMYGLGIHIATASSTSHANLTLKNNISSVDLFSSSTPVVHFYAIGGPSSAYSFGTGGENNNDYSINSSNSAMRTGGLGTATGNALGTEFSTLANWQAAYTTPQDAASVAGNPLFNSSTDLHITTTGSAAENAGAPIALVTTDIDGESRSGTTPDIGADEFTASGPTQTPTSTATPTNTPTPNPFNCPGPDAFGYTCAAATFVYEDISATGTLVGQADDSSFTVTLADPFPFYGTNLGSLVVNSNGWISDPANGNPSAAQTRDNVAITNTAPPNNFAQVFWDDLDSRSTCAGNGIWFQDFVGYAIVQWKTDLFTCSGAPDYDFEIKLFDNGDLEYRYNVMPTGGVTGSAGLENITGTSGLQYSHNQALLTGGSAKKFVYPAGAPTNTATLTPTITATPPNTATPTITPTPTSTATPTNTPTPCPGTSQQFAYADFSNIDTLALNGSTLQNGTQLQLTASVSDQNGSAWHWIKQDVQNCWSTDFTFSLNTSGADGMAFVIQNSGSSALGNYVGGGSTLGYGGIPNSLAVELDTVSSFAGEGTNNVAIQSMGTAPNSYLAPATLAINNSPPVTLNNGQPHLASILYSAGTLSVSIDGQFVLSAAVDLGTLLSLDGGTALVGFTGATGSSFQQQSIRSWNFQGFTPPTPTPATSPTPAPTQAPDAGSACNTTSISPQGLGNGLPYPSNITLAGVSSSLTDLNVRLLSLSHTNADDIDVLLVGPAGQNLILMSDVGGNPNIQNVDLTLDDAASSALPDSTILTTGSYQPTNIGSGDVFGSPAPTPSGATTLATFNGGNPNGTWSLYVVDQFNSIEGGQFTGGWCLDYVADGGTQTPTETPTDTPTDTPTITPTSPPTLTATSTPTALNTATNTRTGTVTRSPTGTPGPPTSTATSVPPTSTATNVPATATATSVVPTATATATGALPTATATATATGVLPTATATATGTGVVPTATATGVLPTATATATGVLPTATATGTSVLPTVTATGTGVLPTATATGTGVLPTATATGTGVLPTATATATGVLPTATATGVVPTATATGAPPTATATAQVATVTPTLQPGSVRLTAQTATSGSPLTVDYDLPAGAHSVCVVQNGSFTVGEVYSGTPEQCVTLNARSSGSVEVWHSARPGSYDVLVLDPVYSIVEAGDDLGSDPGVVVLQLVSSLAGSLPPTLLALLLLAAALRRRALPKGKGRA